MTSTPHRYARYVALGDSSTEGLGDPDGHGGHLGWADRLAAHLAAHQPTLTYANLAVRSRSAGEIAATQLAPALALRPDLATVVAGMNDLLRRDFDPARVAGEVAAMQRALIAGGATVITLTLPDVARRLRLSRRFSARTAALNVELRRACALTGARLLDVTPYPVVDDPRMWSDDRLHAGPEGHARIAAALAELVGVPGTGGWTAPLPPAPRRPLPALLANDAAWIARHVAPWAWRKLRGRLAGDDVVAKRPTLTPVTYRAGAS